MARVERTRNWVKDQFEKSRWFWRRYKKNRAAVAGLSVTIFLVLVALAAPLIAPSNPSKLGEDVFAPPSEKYYMGTDDLGRDVFSRVVFSTRVSLLVGFLAALTSTVIGVLFGTISGFQGGIVDDILMRITEFFQIIPKFIICMLIITLFGNVLWYIILVIALLSWPTTARLVRAKFLSIKEEEFVEAARALGMGKLRIIFGEILPNASAPIVVAMSLQVSSAILMESGLSFLGLGDPAMVSWGTMLRGAQIFLRDAWWMAAFPGFAIFATSVAINLVGDGLNDALNPKLKERR